MSIDWRAHYDAIYSVHGVDAVLTLADSGEEVSLTVIDKTEGVVVEGEGGINVQSLRAAAVARMSDLADQSVSADDVDGGALEFNGKSWTVNSHRPKPAPTGEADGELYLLLVE